MILYLFSRDGTYRFKSIKSTISIKNRINRSILTQRTTGMNKTNTSRRKEIRSINYL